MTPGRLLPRAAVAALFLERQHLTRPRAVTLTPGRLVRFASDVGGIQLDSINVLDRAHHLTLWSRFGPYDRAALERMVYRRRLLFEYWAHAACLVPTTHLPMWRRAMLDYEVGHTGWTSWLRKHAPTMERVVAAFRERGPLGNADFQSGKPRQGPAGWWAWKPESHAMDYLWKKGVLAVHSRVHFQRRLDLIERVLPAVAGVQPPSADEFRRWHVRRSLHAMGAASPTDLRMYLSFPRLEVAERRRTLAAMLRAGEIAEVAVEGQRGPWLALAGDLPALETAARRSGRRRAGPPSRGTTLLAPFDSFLWHRERTRALFGFDYRIEIYTPGPRRVHGYYSLPILHDGALVGRLDAKNHREAGRLEVRSVHFEPWLAGGAAPFEGAEPVALEPALAGIGEAVASLASFVGAGRVTIGRVSPARLAGPLKRALAATQAPERPAR
jgi:hypothetical protein